jgi:tRNA(Ile)-lysidine synthase
VSPSEAAARALSAAFPDRAKILVAVSGGPDSLALLSTSANWAKLGSERAVYAATVDHGLRVESATEAAYCAQIAASLGLSHETLIWSGQKPATGLQAAAREARYRLLAQEARRLGAGLIATAHHADDQAETVLMRLASGSGIAGLGGMRATSALEELVLVRPFLGLRKATLEALCVGRGLLPIDDPSNADSRFGRGRLRRIMPSLAKEGLTVERLNRLAQRASAAAEALDAVARTRLDATMLGQTDYTLRVRWGDLLEDPAEIRLRVLQQSLAMAAPAGGQLRLEALEKLADDLRSAATTRQRLRRTLAGWMVTLQSDGVLTIGLAPPRRTG